MHAFVLVHELVEAALRVLEPVGLLEAAGCLLVLLGKRVLCFVVVGVGCLLLENVVLD